MLILIFSGSNEYSLFIVAFQAWTKLHRLEHSFCFSSTLPSNVYYLAVCSGSRVQWVEHSIGDS